MSTKELIRIELEKVREDDLSELYELIRDFREARDHNPAGDGALSRLRQIRIEAPEDFAVNLDLYTSGEKPLATGTDAG